jgi:hypothetical protein
MGTTAPAPVPAFVNAPFFARLDRRSLDEAVPLNDLLLTEVARLCADAILADNLGLEPDQLLDLVAWAPAALPRLLAALTERGADLAELALLPALGSGIRTTLRAGTLWRSKGVGFNAAAAAAAGVEDLVVPALADARRERLIALAAAMQVSLAPSDEQLAAFAEAFAAHLAATAFAPEAWAGFFDDLALTMPSGDALRGRAILVDEREQLLAAGDGKDGPVVFVARREDDGGDLSVNPPRAVAARLAFTHPAIPRRAEARGPLRSGWKWLEDQGLVREYRTDAVLSILRRHDSC